MNSGPVAIVGGGPVGTLLALLLARRGRRVAVYERRPDPRDAAAEQGRSINLALAARGLRALEAADVIERLRPAMVEMRGRMLHDDQSGMRLLRYGQRPDEVIWSISRARLNLELIVVAATEPLIELHFGQRCVGLDPERGTVKLLAIGDHTVRTVAADLIIGADGAGSAVRAALTQQELCHSSEETLAHDYKELDIAAGAGGAPRLEPNALHIWPRGGHMLIALPNTDGSSTATLFLPRTGPCSFASLRDAVTVEQFFAQQFPDALALLPDLAQQFAAHPQGQLSTVHCWPWHAGRVLLIGDAAHAIVPFHGQGLNCGFEDCLRLDASLAQHVDPLQALTDFERERRPNTDAIAIMAVENYQEMRDTVRDPDFERRQQLAHELERLYPQRFIPRYAMVMFHPEISYADAMQRGIAQERLLDSLLAQQADLNSEQTQSMLRAAGL